MAQLDLGEIVLLEIDIQGGFQVKEKILDTVLIFITTSKKQLQNRLEKRGTDSGATITKRLKNGCVEKKKSKDYDHIILNDDIENALKKLEEIIVGG